MLLKLMSKLKVFLSKISRSLQKLKVDPLSGILAAIERGKVFTNSLKKKIFVAKIGIDSRRFGIITYLNE